MDRESFSVKGKNKKKMAEPTSPVVPQPDQPNPTAKRFEIKKWNAVALWSWDIQVDTCAICRNHIMDLCIECQATSDAGSQEGCPVAFGVCNHAYHQHCISNWLKKQVTCPICVNRDWEVVNVQRMAQ